MLAADRDAAVEQNGQLTRQVNVAWAETDRLKGQMRRLSAPPESVEGMSERLQSMLRLAQDEVSERRKRAEAEATEIVSRAEAEAGELPRQNESIRRQLEHERKQLTFERNKILADAREEADLIRSRATADADSMRATAAAEVEALRQQADEDRRALDMQSSAKRTQVEEDFDIAMSARRAEAMTTIHRSQVASRDEANGLISNARAEAERRVAEARHTAEATVTEARQAADATIGAAQQRVAELDSVRAHMVARLAELRGVLDKALPQLDPSSQQHTEPAGPGSAPPEGPPAHLHNGAALASPAPTGQNGVPAPNGTAFTSNVAAPELQATAPAVSGAGQWDGGPSGTSPGIQELEDTEPGSPTSGDELRGSEPSAAAGGNSPRNDGGDSPN
ncbi:MAG: hypothetical protein QOG57_384, partial [Pseudonocardiales bacterium]|nr:hypothetical protein [Pseudonocardiales bacterium]